MAQGGGAAIFYIFSSGNIGIFKSIARSSIPPLPDNAQMYDVYVCIQILRALLKCSSRPLLQPPPPNQRIHKCACTVQCTYIQRRQLLK
jgi:hypothetical protein